MRDKWRVVKSCLQNSLFYHEESDLATIEDKSLLKLFYQEFSHLKIK
jgi:hypothetical protein